MKVVIVDDWVSNALMIRGALKPLDIEAEIFTDPVRALSWCCCNDPDLILLDYQMPHMDAAAFLGRLRSDDRGNLGRHASYKAPRPRGRCDGHRAQTD